MKKHQPRSSLQFSQSLQTLFPQVEGFDRLLITTENTFLTSCSLRFFRAMDFTNLPTPPQYDLPTPLLYLILCGLVVLPILVLVRTESVHSSAPQQQPQGCRKLGVRSRSNIHDEMNDAKYAKGVRPGKDSDGRPRWRVKALFIYPIKSAGGVEVESANVLGTGVSYDRQFCFAEWLKPQTRLDAPEEEKAPKWTFRTLRADNYNKLAKVQPEIWVPDPKSPTYSPNKEDVKNGGVLLIKYPYEPKGIWKFPGQVLLALGIWSSERSFRLPLSPPKGHDYPIEDVKIWRDTPTWLNMGRHVPQELKDYLGIENPLSIFRADPESFSREVFRCAPPKEDLGYQCSIGFADAYPLNMLNLASVRDIAARVKTSIPNFTARRFRANILMTGPEAYEEDSWKKVRIGDYEHYCACRCVRCKLPNVDPDTAIRHPVEPDRVLKSFRVIDQGDANNACLGLQMVPAKPECSIRVGDEVEVLETGKHLYIPQNGIALKGAVPS